MPQPHQHTASLGDPLYELDRQLPPLLEIASGDSVVIETEDAFSGQIRVIGDRRDKQAMPHSNPVCGPIFVQGAKPGDALTVRIDAIDSLVGQCATYIPALPHVTALLGHAVPPEARICKIEADTIVWSNQLALPFRPMIGVIATAPADETPTTSPAGDYGGNLDLTDICPGSVVSLPVNVDGGLLFVGDCHALQGQGEVTAAALEMAARVTLRIATERSAQIPGPRIETPTHLAAVAVASSLEEAVGMAYSRLALWLEHDHGVDRWDAYSLLSQVGELDVGYFAAGVVAAKIERRYIPSSTGQTPGHNTKR